MRTVWLLGVLAAGMLPAPLAAQCPCMNPDPYARLTPEEHRAKFDELLGAASASYGQLMAAVRGQDLAKAKGEARLFIQHWGEVANGFWSHPPKGLDRAETWLKWFPEAYERFGEGTQLILSADDLRAARPLLEGGRWAVVRIREENKAPVLPDLVLRARQVEESVRVALAARDMAQVRAATRRLDELATASRKMDGSADADDWRAKVRALSAAPSTQTLAAAKVASARLCERLGDRLD